MMLKELDACLRDLTKKQMSFSSYSIGSGRIGSFSR